MDEAERRPDTNNAEKNDDDARNKRTAESVDMPESVNVVVLRGRVRGEPVERRLPSGELVVQFDVATDVGAGRAVVPVSMTDPPKTASAALVGDGPLVVLGAVRRRFFRADGRTQSRTEVVATRVVPVRRRAAVSRLLTEAMGSIGA